MSLLRSTLLACCVTAALAAQPDLPPAPGKLFDIGAGRRLHMLCGGEGSPSILFEVGASAFSIDYTLVQHELQKSHRVCVYDRAGIGLERSAAWPTRSRPMPAICMRCCAAAREPAPYVLVGASRGGLLIRGYLAAYPDEVAGLVFIDPASEDRFIRHGERAGDRHRRNDGGTNAIDAAGTDGSHSAAARPEGRAIRCVAAGAVSTAPASR